MQDLVTNHNDELRLRRETLTPEWSDSLDDSCSPGQPDTEVAASSLATAMWSTSSRSSPAIGRLGQMRLEPRRLDLLDHIPPARAALHRQHHRPTVRPASHVLAKPTTEPLPVGLPDPAPPLLARLHLHSIESDLLRVCCIEPGRLGQARLAGCSDGVPRSRFSRRRGCSRGSGFRRT